MKTDPEPSRVSREEARGLAGRAAQQARRATELEGLLDLVRTRVQDLEERYLGKAARQQSHTLRLQQDRREARVRHRGGGVTVGLY